MALTIGTGPLSAGRAGRLSFEVPERVVLVEPHPRRVRAVVGGRTVIDSDDVKLVHVSGRLPTWALPVEHVDVQSATTIERPYRGTANHWSAVIDGRTIRDVAWSSDDEVLREAEAVRSHLAFYDDGVEIGVGGSSP